MEAGREIQKHAGREREKKKSQRAREKGRALARERECVCVRARGCMGALRLLASVGLCLCVNMCTESEAYPLIAANTLDAATTQGYKACSASPCQQALRAPVAEGRNEE